MGKDYFSNRATVRNYSDKQVPDRVIFNIIERANPRTDLRKHAALQCGCNPRKREQEKTCFSSFQSTSLHRS